jgi:D-3-phosphoglycerate dehydrogenase
MYKVLITDTLPASALALIQDKKEYHVEVRADMPAAALKEKIPEFHALVVRSKTKVDRNLIESAKNLKVIGRAGIGLDNIDLVAAGEKGIDVLNTPGSNADAVAELTIGLCFSLARKLFTAFSSLKSHNWIKSELTGSEIAGKTIGLIGFGTIGQKVGRIAAAIGMRVLTYKSSPIQKSPGYEFELVPLDELLRKSDFVSLHLPRNQETADMITSVQLKLMKPTAFLINCARGGIVNEDDLLVALQGNIIAGAALDVFETEPPQRFELVDHEKVLATPHIGASTSESQARVGQDIIKAVMNILETKYLFITGK